MPLSAPSRNRSIIRHHESIRAHGFRTNPAVQYDASPGSSWSSRPSGACRLAAEIRRTSPSAAVSPLSMVDPPVFCTCTKRNRWESEISTGTTYRGAGRESAPWKAATMGELGDLVVDLGVRGNRATAVYRALLDAVRSGRLEPGRAAAADPGAGRPTWASRGPPWRRRTTGWWRRGS